MTEAWERFEEDLANLIPGGRMTIASGSKTEKGDVQTERDGASWRILGECKATENKGYRVTVGTWDKLVKHCWEKSPEMRPALGIRFHGGGRIKYDLLVMDAYDVAEMLWEMDRQRTLLEHITDALEYSAERRGPDDSARDIQEAIALNDWSRFD